MEESKITAGQFKAIRKPRMTRSVPWLIILSVLVALGLVLLVTSLACELSCNGSEAAAVVLAIGGTALVVFLLIVVLKSLNRKYKKSKEKEVEMPPTGP